MPTEALDACLQVQCLSDLQLACGVVVVVVKGGELVSSEGIVTVAVVVVVVVMVVAVAGTVISGGICGDRAKTVSHWATSAVVCVNFSCHIGCMMLVVIWVAMIV
jgi:hypothetical protein